MSRILDWGLLKPEDIECRIASCKDGKTTILLYQETRNCMKHLDAMFGTFGWQIDYHQAGDMIIATMSVWDDEKQQWISKSDTGSASNIEADKGFCSNCLKRCAVQFGLGRELYTAPRITIDNSNKYAQYSVASISYTDDSIICGLTIIDNYGNIVYQYGTDTMDIQVSDCGNQYSAPVEVKGFAPQQQILTEPKQQKLTKLQNPLTDQGMLDKRLYAQIMKAPDRESLKNIYDMYSDLHTNKYFISTLTKRKTELGIKS